MITNKKERWVREIYNLQSTLGPYDFGYGVRLSLLDNDLAQLIDRSSLHFRLRRTEYPSWIVEAEPKSQSELIDGNPSAGLTILPETLLLVVSPNIKFGPAIYTNIRDGKQEVVSILYDRLVTFWPVVKPDEFTISNSIIKEIHRVFKGVIRYKGERPSIILDRYIRACLDFHMDDAIIDLCIALESLYLDHGENKTDNIACRGSTFIGSDSQHRENIFKCLATIYWIRNKIVHDCAVKPIACLKDDKTMNVNQLRDSGLSHVASALIKLFNDDRLAIKTKKEFVNELKMLVKELNQEFAIYQRHWKYPTLNT